MKKLTLAVEQEKSIITNALYDILVLYDPAYKSNNAFIKVHIYDGFAIIIKMLNTFANGLSYVLAAYASSGSVFTNKFIFSQTIQYDLAGIPANDLIKIASDYIGSAIFELTQGLQINKIRITHNMDDYKNNNQNKLFTEVMRINNCATNEELEDAIYFMADYIFDTLNDITDSMMVRLYFNINIGEPEENSSEFTCKIQYTNVFGNPVYNFLIKYPGQEPEYVLGLNQSEADEFIIEQIRTFTHISSFAFKNDETGILVLYKQKEESNYV